MSHLIWNLEELVRITKSDDKEVRFWAVDRLVRHFPTECCDAIAEFLLDEHDETPLTVARHLGEHGNSKHHSLLLRGFRVLRGLTPGCCLQALARLGYADIPTLAAEALKSGEMTDSTMALIIETLSAPGSPEGKEVMRHYLDRRVELLVEPEYETEVGDRITVRYASTTSIFDPENYQLTLAQSNIIPGSHLRLIITADEAGKTRDYRATIIWIGD